MKKKRAAKVLALALLLGLCLWLTGCYIPPDQITDDAQNMTIGANNLPFNTLAPTEAPATATPTPNPVVSNTDGIDIGSNTGSEPTATVDWNAGWGPTENGTDTPTTRPTGITVITSAPTNTPRATNTPAPTSSSLRNGSTGTAVKTLQERLKKLGYYTGSVDGKYGDGTEAAVKAFQEANGLSADGVAGTRTINKLYSDNAIAASSGSNSGSGTSTVTSAPSRTATPRPTATPDLSRDYYLKVGLTGKKVTTLQNRLIELGWMAGKADGTFGAATQAAVTAFQQKNGLTADGKAGTATLNALYSSDAIASNGSSSSGSDASSGDSSSTSSSVTLQEGDTGDAVKRLQQQLKKLGYYSGSVDGSYGSGTVAAVQSFQRMNNLTVDGKAGPATQSALYGGNATSASYSSLREYDEGTAVTNLQYALYELGYYDGKINGIYGSTTKDAVRQFQINNGLSVDGVAGSSTLKVLYSGSAVSVSAPTTTYTTLRYGDKGDEVVQLQDALFGLGYMVTEATGVYDDLTVAAVTTFQQRNGLNADGVAGSDTQRVLYSSGAIRY